MSSNKKLISNVKKNKDDYKPLNEFEDFDVKKREQKEVN